MVSNRLWLCFFKPIGVSQSDHSYLKVDRMIIYCENAWLRTNARLYVNGTSLFMEYFKVNYLQRPHIRAYAELLTHVKKLRWIFANFFSPFQQSIRA